MPHRQNVTGKNVTDKMSHRQNVTQTKCHTDKMSQDKMLHGQNATGQNVTDEMSH